MHSLNIDYDVGQSREEDVVLMQGQPWDEVQHAFIMGVCECTRHQVKCVCVKVCVYMLVKSVHAMAVVDSLSLCPVGCLSPLFPLLYLCRRLLKVTR